MAGESPGGVTDGEKLRMISSGVLEINGLSESRPITHHIRDSSSPSDTITSRLGIEGNTKPGPRSHTPEEHPNRRLAAPSSGISHLPLTANPRSKITESTDDERRLLPGNYIDDPDAVLIGRPQTKGAPPHMAGGLLSGGPRPTNTLTSTPYEYSSRVSGMAKGLKRSVGASVDVVRALVTKTTYGDNVKTPNGRDALADISTERAAKRPKLGSSNRSQDSVRMFNEDDDVDMLPVEQGHVRRHRSPQRKSRTPSLLSQHSNLNPKSYPPNGRYVNEYRVVESTMDSKPRGRRGTHHQHANQLSIPIVSADEGPPPVIDLSADDVPPKAKPIWKGTARSSASRAAMSTMFDRSGGVRQSGYTSDHFPKPIPSQKAFNLTSEGYNSTAKSTRSGSHKDSNLRDSFVQSDGMRRNSNVSLSSDELHNEPYDTVTRESPQRRTGREEFQDLHAEEDTTTEDLSIGLPQSNIPSTTFSTHRRNAAPRKASASRAQQTNRDTFLGVSLVSFSYGSLNFEEVKGQNSGLAANNSDSCLDVYVDGANITGRSPGRRIQPEKLQKIIWADSSRKMRLEFSKCGTEDGKGDLELGSAKDVAQLVRYLQTSSPRCKVVQKTSEIMDRMFITRSSEQKAYRQLGDGGLKHATADVALLEARKQRRDGASQTPQQPGCRRSKRRSTDSRLIDQLNKKSSLNYHSGNPSKDYSNEGSLQATEPSVAKHLKNQKLSENSPTNPHATRSTVPRSKHLPSPFEGLPSELRYSKMHGLGPRWSKPLIYPKIGKKKTTVEYVDLERLDEGEFLNDNLIGFYLRFLENQLEERDPDLAKRVYFFNTYFFASLTNTPRGKRGINYEAVQKWTRSINLFEYDYVVVPINESAHWYVAIICNLPFINRLGVAMDNDTPESTSIAQITELEVSDDRSASPLQQVSPKVSKEDVFTSLEMELERPNEQDTRESFAEMNLEDGIERPPHGPDGTDAPQHEVSPVEKDEVDLSVIPQDHPNVDMGGPEAAVDEDNGTDQAKVVLEQGTELQNLPLKVPAPIKRGKRKSLPPQRVSHPDQPTIITFDSLGLAHAPTVRNLKDYLHEEGKTKRSGMEWEDTQIRGMTAKEIPLQDNFCDCGLFLLGYVEKFLEDPRDFISKTLRKEIDKEKDWPSMVPSQLRSRVRELIRGLHDEQMDEKRENAIKAGKYRGNRQQVPALTTTDTTQSEGKAACMDEPVLPTVLGNQAKPTTSVEPTEDDLLESTVMDDEEDHSVEQNMVPSKPATMEDAKDHADTIHEVRASVLGTKDSTPIVLDSQSQGQSTYEQAELELRENGGITITIADSQPEVPMTPSQETTRNGDSVAATKLAKKNGRRGQKEASIVLCE